MPVPFVYLDECVDPRLAVRLRQRRFQVTTAQSEGTLGLADEAQLEYATGRDFMLVSHDQQDFRRWHAIFQRQGRLHGGILLLPFGPLSQIEIRTAMMLDWITLQPDYRSRLFRWHDLQSWLIQGNRLPGYSGAELQLALGQLR